MHAPSALLCSLALLSLGACRADGSSAAERADWIDLGTPEHWRGYQEPSVPATWSFEQGTIRTEGSGKDLITRDEFQSFELELEWKVSPGGNSGIMYHVSEDQPQTYMTGPEMQVFDDASFQGGEVDLLHSAGADYALYEAVPGSSKPAGEWNAVRMRVDGPHVTYWLNGVEQCSYELWSDDWERRVAGSKFAAWPSFGRNETGYVALQAHGSPVWYRNVRIRRL